jgi:hypothetical protein
MLDLIFAALAVLPPAPQEPGTPAPTKPPHLYRQYRQPTNVAAGPPKTARVIIRVPHSEWGTAGHAWPVTITVDGRGREQDLILKEILERLGEKPVPPRP